MSLEGPSYPVCLLSMVVTQSQLYGEESFSGADSKLKGGIIFESYSSFYNKTWEPSRLFLADSKVIRHTNFLRKLHPWKSKFLKDVLMIENLEGKRRFIELNPNLSKLHLLNKHNNRLGHVKFGKAIKDLFQSKAFEEENERIKEFLTVRDI